MLTLSLPAKESGELRISGTWTDSIGPLTSRTAFLQSRLGSHSSPETTKPPYFGYEFRSAELRLDEYPAFLLARFEGELLLSCTVYLDIPREWSEEAELAVKAKQDEVLRRHYQSSPPYAFTWGTVSSLYHPQHCGSDIGIIYRLPSYVKGR